MIEYILKIKLKLIIENKLIFQVRVQKYRNCVVRILISCFRIRTNVSCTTIAPWRTVLCLFNWNNTCWNVRIRVCSLRSRFSVKTSPKFAVVSERKSRINVGEDLGFYIIKTIEHWSIVHILLYNISVQIYCKHVM